MNSTQKVLQSPFPIPTCAGSSGLLACQVAERMSSNCIHCYSRPAAAPRQSLAAVRSDRHLCTLACHQKTARRPYLLLCCHHRPQLRPLSPHRFWTVGHLLLRPLQHDDWSQEESAIQRRGHRSSAFYHRHVGFSVLVSRWLSGSDGVTWCCHPWRGQRGSGCAGDAGQLGHQPFPVHPQPADGETPHQQRGTASQVVGDSARIKLAHL